MSKFLKEINVTIFGTNRELRFETTDDMKRWLDAEEPFWRDADTKQMNGQLRTYWEKQRSFFAGARNQLQQYENSLAASQTQQATQFNEHLRNNFNQLAGPGTVATSDWQIFPVIVDMAKVDLDVAGLLYVMARNDAPQVLGTFSNLGIPFKSLLNFILLYSRSKGTRDWLQPQRNELITIKDDFQRNLNEIRAAFEAQGRAISEQRDNEHKAHSERDDQWNSFKERLESEWVALKKVYDEQLALLAPTQYWGDRARTHKQVAIGFAISFGLVLVGSIGIFAWLAMPHLFDIAGRKDVSTILALTPVAIPAFAGIWVLKMLSRLLSENLQMMRDAKERETMVKTFLALMRDDKNGKSIVNDNDRILILHSLFRPSSVSAVDDAPPVHWFDILTNKVSGGGAAKS